MSESEQLTQQFSTLYAQVNSQAELLGQQLETSVAQANSLLSNIASLNQQIQALSTSSQAPNELLDQRDLTVQKIV